MTEQKPEPTEKISLEPVRDFIRSHRLTRAAINGIFRLSVYASMFLTPTGREILNDPIRRRVLFYRESQVGFLEDSIIYPEIYHPNKEGTSLERRSAEAGRWAGYDFYRPKEFNMGKEAFENQVATGKLVVFALDEIKNNTPDTYTPTSLFQCFDFCHSICFKCPTIEEAIEEGYLKENTYRDAYDKVGLLEKYRLALTHSGIVDNQVYTVTPKGNGLVSLMSDQGKKVTKTKETVVLKPALENQF